MTATEEREMHELVKRLLLLTEGTGWEAMRYMQIGQVIDALCEYCRPSCAIREKVMLRDLADHLTREADKDQEIIRLRAELLGTEQYVAEAQAISRGLEAGRDAHKRGMARMCELAAAHLDRAEQAEAQVAREAETRAQLEEALGHISEFIPHGSGCVGCGAALRLLQRSKMLPVTPQEPQG